MKLSINKRNIEDTGIDKRLHAPLLKYLKHMPEPEHFANSFEYVSDWLPRLGMTDFIGTFIAEGLKKVLIVKCADLTEEKLKNMGISKPGHFNRILGALEYARLEEALGVAARRKQMRKKETMTPPESPPLYPPMHHSQIYTFSAHYLGSDRIESIYSEDECINVIKKLKKQINSIVKTTPVQVEISIYGVMIFNTEHQKTLLQSYQLDDIGCMTNDMNDRNCLGFTVQDKHQSMAHVFAAITAEIAKNIIDALGDVFKIQETRQQPCPYYGQGAQVAHESVNPFGETIVENDVKARVVIFGYWLEKVEYITFTDSNCYTSEFNISNKDFELQIERRIELQWRFPENKHQWRMCVKQKGPTGELLMVEGIHTYITTRVTPKEYIMPFYLQCSVLAFLLSMSALFSGLNLGLMSLSINELQLIMKCGSRSEQKYAKAILPIRRRGNQLLCTILLMNVVVNASISILFEDMTSGTIAFIVSSAGIVVFGEICPQSICVKKGLAVGARTLFLTKFFMALTYPLAFPISKILDWLVGVDVDKFDRNRLLEIMKMGSGREGDPENLKIAIGALELASKSVMDVMTKIEDTYMLPSNTVVNPATIAEIAQKGYSRIPIFDGGDRNNIVSLLYVKELALVNKNANITVGTVGNRARLRFVDENHPLTEMGEYHMAIIRRGSDDDEHFYQATLDSLSNGDIELSELSPSREILGVITLEDIVEEILQAEIMDESDQVTDNVQRHRRFAKNSLDLHKLLGKEKQAEPLSIHTKSVLCRYLRDQHPIFGPEFMEPRGLEHLIGTNVRVIYIANESQPIPIYEYGVTSKRAVVILEGSATVFFPKSKMTLQAGSWISLGEVLFQKLQAGIAQSPQDAQFNLSFVPDFTVTVEKYCKFVQLPVPSVWHKLKISNVVRSMRTNSNPSSRSPSISEKNRRIVRFQDDEGVAGRSGSLNGDQTLHVGDRNRSASLRPEM
ncbi:unnamed protein product, partial [Mesorhabditis spiculigera]